MRHVISFLFSSDKLRGGGGVRYQSFSFVLFSLLSVVPVRVPSLSRAQRCHGVEIKKE